MKKLKIAITGGIGSGKTECIKFLKINNYSVLSCDEVWREVQNEEDVLKILVENFSDDIILNGQLNRRLLAQKVFCDPKKTKLLNNITHPFIMKRLEEKIYKIAQDIIFVEVPLLFESKLENQFDKIWIIMRDKKIRIQAVKDRDNLKEIEIKNRINNQFTYEKLDKNAHTLIYNNGSLEEFHFKILTELKNIERENL